MLNYFATSFLKFVTFTWSCVQVMGIYKLILILSFYWNQLYLQHDDIGEWVTKFISYPITSLISCQLYRNLPQISPTISKCYVFIILNQIPNFESFAHFPNCNFGTAPAAVVREQGVSSDNIVITHIYK